MVVKNDLHADQLYSTVQKTNQVELKGITLRKQESRRSLQNDKDPYAHAYNQICACNILL
jgi:hypothetical protein